MDSFTESLTSLGLTSTEAHIYLNGLAHGSCTVQDIAHKTKIKRPTVYHALSTLLEKGLILETKVQNRTHFKSTPPEHMRGIIEQQRALVDERSRRLEELLPSLLHINTSPTHNGISVIQHEGIEGMKMVMDMAFYCTSKKWDIIAPYKNFLREYDKAYAQKYLNARKYRGITSRTLWEDTMREGRRLTAEEIQERNPRLMPKALHGKFKSMMIFFDDKIAIFSSYEKLSAVLITSSELHTMFQAMFDGLWESSEKY